MDAKECKFTETIIIAWEYIWVFTDVYTHMKKLKKSKTGIIILTLQTNPLMLQSSTSLSQFAATNDTRYKLINGSSGVHMMITPNIFFLNPK